MQAAMVVMAHIARENHDMCVLGVPFPEKGSEGGNVVLVDLVNGHVAVLKFA